MVISINPSPNSRYVQIYILDGLFDHHLKNYLFLIETIHLSGKDRFGGPLGVFKHKLQVASTLLHLSRNEKESERKNPLKPFFFLGHFCTLSSTAKQFAFFLQTQEKF